MTVYAITDTNKGRTGIAPTYLSIFTFYCSVAFCQLIINYYDDDDDDDLQTTQLFFK